MLLMCYLDAFVVVYHTFFAVIPRLDSSGFRFSLSLDEHTLDGTDTRSRHDCPHLLQKIPRSIVRWREEVLVERLAKDSGKDSLSAELGRNYVMRFARRAFDAFVASKFTDALQNCVIRVEEGVGY
jgi:hypothetical protein